MSEEEKKVIETCKKGYKLTKAQTEIISNLIEKEQKEREELNSDLEVFKKSIDRYWSCIQQKLYKQR